VGHGGQLSPWALEHAVRSARERVRKCSRCGAIQVRSGKTFKCAACKDAASAPGLPEGLRYHDLRHYLASILIANGADVKTVQARLCHGSATTALNTYSHRGQTKTNPRRQSWTRS
jgi:integrase